MSEKERKDGRELAVTMNESTGEVMVKKPGEDIPKVFTFDSVYD
jgi:hypothetical protein